MTHAKLDVVPGQEIATSRRCEVIPYIHDGRRELVNIALSVDGKYVRLLQFRTARDKAAWKPNGKIQTISDCVA